MKKLIITLLAFSPLFASAQDISNYAENLTPYKLQVLSNLSTKCEALLDEGRYWEAKLPCGDFAGAVMSLEPKTFSTHVVAGHVMQPYGFCGVPENNPKLCAVFEQASRTSRKIVEVQELGLFR